MNELLTAIGLIGAYRMECELRVRLGMPWCNEETFLNCAAPVFLCPSEMLRAMQAGVTFSQPPANVQFISPGRNWGKGGGGLGGDHRVGGGAQRVYPFRSKPQ